MPQSSYLLKSLTVAVGLAVLGLATGASAQTKWTGASSSNWSDPTNWDAGGLPDNTKDAIIDHDFSVTNNPVLDADGSALNLYVGTGYNSLLTISDNYTLDVSTVVSGVTSGNIYLGGATNTTGTITQSAGTVSADMIYAGSTTQGQTGAGNYTMTGGTLNVNILSLGNRGTSTFTQSGGVVINPVCLWLGDAQYPGDPSVPGAPGGPGSATCTIEGDAVYDCTSDVDTTFIAPWGGYGVLTVQGNATFNNHIVMVEVPGSTAVATGIINLRNNAQMNLTGPMTLASAALTTGTLNQEGGTLTVPRIEKGVGTGTYNFTGGTLNVSEIGGMGLVNGGGTLNVGGTGAVTNLVMDTTPVTNNIALGKTATQIGTAYGMGPERAVDGVFTNFSHTTNEDNAWWQVDLTGDDSNTSVHDIVLTARYDGWTYGLSNFFVRVLDKDGVTVVWQDKFIDDPSELLGKGENLWVSLPAAVDGRYVQVQLDGVNLGTDPSFTKTLTITEVQVGDVERYGYSQAAASTLGIELDPTNALGDKLVAGAVTIDGTLDVTAISTGFAAGQTFDILDWETLVGTFDAVNLPTLSSALAWDVSSLYVTGELKIVSGVQIPGDANGSGTVDAADAKILAQNWGSSGQDIGWAQGDFNKDNVVNAADASILAANWDSTGEAAGVPEPGVVAMLLIGAAGLLMPVRRRRKTN